jgi:DNA-directed RNA polymerase II subunit RPB2
MDAQNTTTLTEYGDLIEEPFTILESYFRGQHLERLVRHQIESFNHFSNYQILRTIQMFNPVIIHSDNDFVIENEQYMLEIFVSFENLKLYPPQIHENNGATKMMLPQEAKLRNFTYSSTMTVDLNIQYVIRNTEKMDTPKIINKVLPKINIGKLPIMLKSSICVLTQNKHISPELLKECPMDCGGYFIIKGSEKTVLGQERAAENRIYCFDGKNTPKWNWFAEIKSVPDFKCISPKQIEMMISSKNNGFGNAIYISIPRIKQPIELFVLFRALGVENDKQICQYIVLDIENEKYTEVLNFLQASIIDSNKYTTMEDAIRHITSYVAYTPMNMDREMGNRKKREFAMDVLNNDLFPHCKTPSQKLYLLGYMANKLIQTSFGWKPTDDRDSYLNKRIDLTGTLLNNLFRNYFNKLVKEMQKQVIREINNGSWRSSEDYENIINMTNIYKIVKSTTIENGITRALATGDFSIKQANSSKVGVAQVLSRLTYPSSLSHLRRINTPLEKSGELIAPRKLHNTTFGYLCPVESPEGQSIGVVKNISYMAHITIPVNSASLYEYVEPYILKVENTTSTELCDKIKVFINGAWVGTTNEPVVLYNEMKNKKYQGIVNIYTSIVFDFKMGEIRICSDGGRLTRPLLRVQNNNQLMINLNIIRQIENEELGWNDLLISGKLENSVLEYIDPEEQNYSMIYMKNKNTKDNTQYLHYKYTHSEIHPSTIFGILASCSPFPEHNQAPRNTYQTAMIKQAIGIYAMNYDQRMDKSAYILTYPSKPLVDTRLINFIHLNRVPSGCQIHVAIMTNTGYNQEDSILINKGSIDRGLFTATIYHTERDEDKNIIRDEIIRCKPDPSKTKGIKFGNYGKLNAKGFIPENSLVENRDIIIAKIIPIKENRNDMTKIIKYEDQSKSFRTTEQTYIDKNYTGRNGDGYNFAKVRVRTFRKPVLGDKFACALPTQQVLTDAGWVEFQHLDILKHKVCTLDTNGNMCYENPIQKFEYDHDGFLYFVSNKQVRIICTLNHNLYVKNNTENFQLFQAQEIMRKPVQFQKSLNNVYPDIDYITLTTENYPMDALIQLFALFINDKTISSFKNKNILNELGVCYYYNKKSNEFQMDENKHPELFDYFDNLEKRFPEFVWNLSKRQSILLLENIVLYKNTYHTISTNLANDIARLATHCGWTATIKFIEIFGSFENHYNVYIEKIHNQPFINKPEQEHEPDIGITNEGIVAYCGKVYCIEMPSSNLYYFRENMYSPPMLSGNSRSAQKGTVGNIIPEEDMPFTKDGLRPDIILNPHAIPSRMTIGQLKETLLGKVLLELGLFGDGTSFGDLDVATIANELLKCGYESYGNEIMYNGMSGEQFETSIFLGPVFYQRLKHMVNDKQHSRAIGPMVNLTHQPAEGRSRDGGFRIGEMERDVLISHGMTKFTRERLFDVSDKYSVYICKKCGMIACYNDGDKNRMYVNNDFSIHLCKTCGNKTDFALVEMPYANKLLFQELQTINVVPRVITE